MATLQLNSHLISNKEDLTKLIDFLDNDPSALVTGLDLETTVTETVFDKCIRTIQIGNRDIQFCIDLKHFAKGDVANQGFFKTPEWAIPIKDALEKRYFCNPKYLKVGHYLQFECMILKWCLGIDVYGLYCTYLAEQILNAGKVRFTESGFYGLDDIAKRRCNFVMDKTLQTSFNLTDELSSDQIYYACLDVRVPLAIRKSQLKDIDLLQVAEVVKVENDAIPAFANMHCNGFYLDWEKWQKTLEFYKNKHVANIKELDKHFIPVVGKKSTEEELLGFKNIVDQAEIAWRNETKDKLVRAVNRKYYQELNRKYKELVEFQETCEGEALINYGSNLQILEALTKIGFKIKNTDDQTLSLLEDHPIIKALQNFRATQKILSTYGDNWQKYINPITGRVHSDFQQIGAETGRTSSKNPNNQNIIRPEKGEPSFRACFTSLQRPGYVLLISDMSGAELRLIAELSGEPVWVDAYLKGIDVHSLGAELIYQAQWWASQEADCAYRLKGEKCKCTLHKILRDFVKAINFGIAYGMEARKLASQLKIPIEQAQILLDNYRETFKAIIAVLKKLGDKGKTDLVSRDLIGRPRFFTKPTLEMAKEKLLKDQAAKVKKNETFNVTTSRIRQKYFSMYSAIEREAKNHPFQSGNVSIAKLAAGAGYDKNGKPFLYHILKNYDARLVNFVHDEFVIEVAEDQAEELRLEVEDAINRAGKEYMKLVEMLSESKISEIWEK